jgi:hypothetical protein
MKIKSFLCAGALSALFVAAAAGQTAFTPGSIVVLRVGDGSASLTSVATAVFLEEISPLGTPIQTLAMPTAATTAGNRAATTSGSATSEGFLKLSVDGRFLTFGGYNADPGTTGVASTTTSAVNRVVARIAADGTIDTSTALSDTSFNASNIRAVASTDGGEFWIAGNGSPAANGGVRYALFGGMESTLLSATPTNTRVVGIFDNQVYVTTGSGTFKGVSALGMGLPTSSGNTTVLLSGFDPLSTSTLSNYDFFFADATTLYVADDRSLASGGGVMKWTFDGFTWTHVYTLNTGLTASVRGLAGMADRAGNTLYVTTADSISASNGNKLMRVVDTGQFSDFVLIATAPGNTAFRGVAFAPEGSGGPACYANCDGSTTTPVLNVDDFTCFINNFAIGQSLPHAQQISAYANCDGSSTEPVLNVDDFTCFINQFALGCP